MASLTTQHCAHQWMRDWPGEPCIFCGAPKPSVVEMMARTAAKAMAERTDAMLMSDAAPPFAIRSERGEGKQTISVSALWGSRLPVGSVHAPRFGIVHGELVRGDEDATPFLSQVDPGDEDR